MKFNPRLPVNLMKPNLEREIRMDTKNRLKAWLAAGMVLATSAVANAGDFKVEWKDGIKLKSDEASCAIGGRIYFDWYWQVADKKMEAANGAILPLPKDGYPMKDGTNIRTGRLDMSCTVYKHFEVKFQPNFAGNAATFEDAFIALKKLPGDLDIKIGHFKEPFSLEELTSSRFITFLERSSVTGAFAPARNMGISIANTSLLNKTATITTGIFRETGANHRLSVADDTAHNWTTRMTWAPLLEDGGKELLHLGFAYSWKSPQVDSVSFSAKPAFNQGSTLIQTGTMGQLTPASVVNGAGLGSVKAVNIFGFELAAQQNFENISVSLQGEYDITKVNRRGMGNPTLWGYYLQGGLMYNGYRAYKGGTFDRPKLKENAIVDGGIGAWELALRWAQTDFKDKNAPGRSATALAGPRDAGADQVALPAGPLNFIGGDGGKMNDFTVALNWYMTPNFTLKNNWTYVTVKDSDSLTLFMPKGSLNVFQSRIQADW